MITSNLMRSGPVASGTITTVTPRVVGDPLAYGDKDANSYMAGSSLGGAYLDPTSLGIGVVLAIGLLVFIASEGTKSMVKNPSHKAFWSRGPWEVFIKARGDTGSRTPRPYVMVVGEGANTFHADYPIMYDDGTVAFDRPEAIPQDVKKAAIRALKSIR